MKTQCGNIRCRKRRPHMNISSRCVNTTGSKQNLLRIAFIFSSPSSQFYVEVASNFSWVRRAISRFSVLHWFIVFCVAHLEGSILIFGYAVAWQNITYWHSPFIGHAPGSPSKPSSQRPSTRYQSLFSWECSRIRSCMSTSPRCALFWVLLICQPHISLSGTLFLMACGNHNLLRTLTRWWLILGHPRSVFLQ